MIRHPDLEAEQAYNLAMRAFLDTPPTAGNSGEPLPSRAEIYDRAGLRR